jgi:4-amino-4-deoxy-L-arabinose transferase-like glycosyltransferase
MEPDAGVYASVSKNMVLRNNFWELYFQGAPWLDKPHFPFWITALFFKVFGFTTWAYKLPGILFVFMGAWYTYLFAKKYYNETIAVWSAFILLTTLHIIISNNDVRAEPFLTGLIIAAIYHFSKSVNKSLSWDLLFACLFTACAIMTKGIFTIIPIGGAVVGQLIITRQWKQVLHWRWLIVLLVIALFILPEIYALWYQFGTRGIKFFLWDSQFGRFTNTGPIKGKGDPFFFLHTLLWAFLPWSLLMYASIIKKFKSGSREWYTISGALLCLLVFSLSKFQLPYYSNIIFPLLAILTANFIYELKEKKIRTWKIIQTVLAVLFILVMLVLQVLYQPKVGIVSIMGMILAVVLAFFAFYYLTYFFRSAAIAILALSVYMNLVFYPDLLKYQSGSEAAFYINKDHHGDAAVITGLYSPVYEFYSNNWVKIDTSMNAIPEKARRGIWLVAPQELRYLEKVNLKYAVIKEVDDFHVTMLKLKFLNKSTRPKTLEKYYLIRVMN